MYRYNILRRMHPIMNDFSIRIATVNGTGSQSSNNIIFKTLFRMGIHVSPKNIFPSNIKGLATWYQIRVSPKGYQSMKESSEIAVWLNPKTIGEDMAVTPKGGVVIFNSEIMSEEFVKNRPDLILYPIPMTQLTKDAVDKPKLRPLLTNMVYVGAISELFGLDSTILEGVVKDTFKSKESVVKLNLDVIQAGAKYIREKLPKKDPYQFKKQSPFKNKITIEGNSAVALGALFGGCTFLSWYPITPSSSLAESLESYFKDYRHTADGKAKYAVVQAEDELAAAGMIMGAGWAGARAMTTTSGPGMSLVGEFVGYGYYTEIPTVLVNVQRVGPSTGLPTRTQQGDLRLCAFMSHGDTKHVLIFPATIQECFHLTQEAFNFAEEFQTPVFVMSDLDIGMNWWVSDDLTAPEGKFRRGKVLTQTDFEKGVQFARYKDVDGDGIPYRTLPFTEADGAAYFTRGSGHNENAAYTESHEVYERVSLRLHQKYETIRTRLPLPIVQGDKTAKQGIIAIGSSEFAVQESLDQLKSEGVICKYCRPLAYPFHAQVGNFIKSCETVFVVDQNRDSQLQQLLTLTYPELATRFKSVRYFTGMPIPANAVTRGVLSHLGKSTTAYAYELKKIKSTEVD